MKKFICKGGYVISENDGDRHFIGVRELCNLYGVRESCTQRDTRGVNYTWFELTPQYDGNYNLMDTIDDQLENKWKPIWERLIRSEYENKWKHIWEKQIRNEYENMSLWQKIKFLIRGLK
jgi:hypothetical protein